MLGAEAYVSICSKVDHELRAFHGWRQSGAVEQVSFTKSELRMGHRRLKEAPLPRREIIESNNRMAIREKPVHHVAPDKSSRTGYKNPQINLPKQLRQRN
jgi:hypothetical protein